MLKRYDITNLLKTNAEYMIILGQKSNGKSYQVKKTVIEDSYKNGNRFVYLRRWDTDAKAKKVNRYFEDMPIKELTNGEFDGIRAYMDKLFFTQLINGRHSRVKECGYYCALNQQEHNASMTFLNPKYIVFEEFITTNYYLDNETAELQKLINTIGRNEKTHTFLVGNTFTRVCPYFNDYELDGILKQPQGTIKIYPQRVDHQIINIAVEYCEEMKNANAVNIGKAAKAINSGVWNTNEYPIRERGRNYDLIYQILIDYDSFKFVMELLYDEDYNNYTLYVYPMTLKNKQFRRIITNRYSPSPYITNTFYLPFQTKNERVMKIENLMRELLRNGDIIFSDNVTGTDFTNCVKTYKLI